MSLSDQLAPLILDWARELRDAAEDRLLLALANAAPDGPPREGGGPKLKDSFVASPFETGDTVGTVISNDVEHAEWVSEGTPAHQIIATTARALHYFAFNKEWFITPPKFVNHPGTKPNEYFDLTCQRWGEFLESSRLDR